jgi:hypothetical protein
MLGGDNDHGNLDKDRRKRWLSRIVLTIFALVAVSVTLGVLLGLAAKNGSPSVSPISTTSPPQSPSPAPSVSAVDEFLSGLPAYSLSQAYNNASSPQALALDWLRQDPKFNEYESYRLHQRYALAVFFYSTNGTGWNGDGGWLSDENECNWYMDDDSCSASFRLTALSLSGGLEGSIPAELELLVDLETINLQVSTPSGTIHSEM